MNTGLCPRVKQSGATDARGPISKHGPKYLRWALFEAAIRGFPRPRHGGPHLVRSGRSSSAHDVLVPGPKAQARDGTRHERSVPMHRKGEPCAPLGRVRGAP